jgi:energy-coupling factor transport system permease protein
MVFLAVFARIPSSSLKLFLKSILWLDFLIFFFNILLQTLPGNTLFTINLGSVTLGFWNLKLIHSTTDTDILFATSYALRLLALAFGTAVLFVTTKQADLIYNLRKIGIPYSLSLAVGLILRFIIVFIVDYSVIQEAQMSRALDFEKGNLARRGIKLLAIGVPLAILSLRRAEQLTNALESRGFGSGLKRTFYNDVHLGRWDYFVAAISIGLAVSLALLRWRFGLFGSITLW